MVELNKIPHIDEISNHGAFAGAGQKKTATFRERYFHQNKVVPSLEDAIRRTGLKDGMTISFHHHFRNGDHIINMVIDKLAEMGYKTGHRPRTTDPAHQKRRYHPYRDLRPAR